MMMGCGVCWQNYLSLGISLQPGNLGTLELSENLIFWGSNKLAIRNPELRWQKIRAEPGMTQETAQYRK